MLERGWRKGNPVTLLVEMQIDTATMENRTFKKPRNKPTMQPSNPTTGHIPWENHNWKRHMYPNCSTCTLTAALFTVARTCMQPRCPLTNEWIKEQWYIYTMEYFSAIKNQCIWVSSHEVSESRAYYTQWNKSDRECISRKIVLINLCAGQQWRCRPREQTYGHRQGRRGCGKWRQ